MKKPHSKPPNSLYNSRHPLVSQSSLAKMEKKRVMVQSKDLDFSTVKYEHEVTKAPRLTGLVAEVVSEDGRSSCYRFFDHVFFEKTEQNG
uniref:Uncharacterized protein n=1 Tax=Gossypium raimondii TaxID=29730 RepID=A0A0D2Q7J2_GOSRA|nr:hypothetical protein B456_009G021800 [Gossypium raimondii]